MKLARIVFRDSPWWLEDDTEINPEVGTIVQFQEYYYEVVVYFPGYAALCIQLTL